MYILRRSSRSWHRQKDSLHQKRKELAGQIREGLMTKDEMNRGDEGEPEFDSRVQKYDKWREKNEPRMREWSEINRSFKQNQEEGRPQSVDSIREQLVTGKQVRYE